MSNAGELKIGGRTIVRGSGPAHTATLLNGTTGTVLWCVSNGICCIYMNNVNPPAGQSNVIVAENLPKAKIAGHCSSTNGDCWVYTGETRLVVNRYSGTVYNGMSYPVADDYVES